MVSAPFRKSSNLGLSLARDIVLLSRTLYSLAVSYSTQVYKWVLTNLMLGVAL